MRYRGGKCRIAIPLAQQLKPCGGRAFVSLFCGSCAVECKVQGFDRLILNDKHEYLIALWRALQNGWEPPENMSKEEWLYIRAHKDENPALAGFAGFGCSFGGIWFECYARDERGDNYCDISRRALLRDIEPLRNAEFLCKDYREVEIPPNSVVYADPPYAGTRGYKETGKFNTAEFWEYMRKLAKDGHTVYVSEQTAPEDVPCIWEKEKMRTIAGGGKQKKAVERLYCLRPDYDELTTKKQLGSHEATLISSQTYD